jgi:hypothetical protein
MTEFIESLIIFIFSIAMIGFLIPSFIEIIKDPEGIIEILLIIVSLIIFLFSFLVSVVCIYKTVKDTEYTVIGVVTNEIKGTEINETYVYLQEEDSKEYKCYRYIGEENRLPKIGDIINMNGFTLENNYKNLE